MSGRDKQSISLKDGRILSYAEYGDPQGLPMIGFHGLPGSRVVMKAFEKAALSAGARILAADRPGYGYSTPHPGGNLFSHVADVLELADAMGIERFVAVGVSGGGPYALACAGQIPERLLSTGVISGIGPLWLPGSMTDMQQTNRLFFSLGRISPGLAGFLLPILLRASLPGMQRQVKAGTSPSPTISPEVFAVVAEDQAEAIRQNGKGIIFDMANLTRPWGFKLEEVASKVYLWHGAADDLAPARLAHYVVDHLPNCTATFLPGEGHAEAWLNHDRRILQTLTTAHSTS